MSSPKYRSVKLINNPIRPESIHKEVKDIKPQIIIETELKRFKRCDFNVKI
jgi:hypothetical protein